MATYVFKATLQEEDDGRWSAWVETLLGCTTLGYTREEAMETLQDGAELYIECMLEHGDPIPDADIPNTGEATVTVSIDPVVA